MNTETSQKTVAIVLGGGLKKVESQGQICYEPEDQAKARLDQAYALFEAGKVNYIISTGKYSIMARVDPAVTGPHTEAEVGKNYLIAKAKANGASEVSRRIEKCIFCEDQSLDTIGNAWFAKKLWLEPLGLTSCIVVTSDYHVVRSRVIFEWVLGPQYTVACMEAPSQLSNEEREHRDRFEKALTDYVNTHLVSVIPAGDDAAIQKFMENEHQTLFAGIGATLPKPA